MNRRSLRVRILVWYAGVLAVILGIAGVGIVLALKHSIRQTVDKELRFRLRAIRPYIDQQTASNRLPEMVEELQEENVLTPAATNLKVSDVHGRWIYRAPGTEHWDLTLPERASLPGNGRTETIRAGNGQLRVLTAPVKIGMVEIALPVDELQEVENGFVWTLALGSPFVLLLASAGGYWISGRALWPLHQLADAAERITAANLSERLPQRETGDELDRLAAVLNGMLGRLESSFRRITQFTADASHELRTPVAIIRTTAEVTQSRVRTPEEHKAAWENVLAQTERTSRLLTDLLTLARADAQEGTPHFDLVELSRPVQEACSEMAVIAQAEGLRIVTHLSDTGSVRGDSDALRRIVVILLDNALKATEAPGTIEVSLTLDSAMATLQVKDPGAGIGPDDLPHIFDRFYRVSKHRSRQNGGAGLGLSIAHWIVAQHGGTIRAESELGHGSTFTVVLPLCAE